MWSIIFAPGFPGDFFLELTNPEQFVSSPSNDLEPLGSPSITSVGNMLVISE